ncbi:MAG: DNA-protecting protein DprA [Myxococcaceae bacterium]|nr:DNA-protecting protein DprA [Myxococcaceae bacterium]MCI0671732.1 DNA-protecting protein DprA [Myxococcaceae bacterium]
MAAGFPELISGERHALLGLWAIPGLGTKALASLREGLGSLEALLDRPIREWCGAVRLTPGVRAWLLEYPTLAALAEGTLARAQVDGMRVCFPGDAAFPTGLLDIPDTPPLLFFKGEVTPPQRWVAMVGSRRPDAGFALVARRFARDVAAGGVGIVSGAAEGVDRAAHWGAMDAEAPTWAFVGSALDQLDAGPEALLPHLLEKGGAMYSELPPGTRASPQTFPRRNRLISGAAHAVVVLRAAAGSGSLHTVTAAEAQQRPVLALPAEADNLAARGCNTLIQERRARLCLGPEDVWNAVGVSAARGGVAHAPAAVASAADLSAAAQQAYALLARRPRVFEDVLAECALPSATLTSALSELELYGLVVQHPGKLYARV